MYFNNNNVMDVNGNVVSTTRISQSVSYSGRNDEELTFEQKKRLVEEFEDR